MKGFAYLTVIALFAGILVSCAAPASPTIEPGTKIGDFLVTKGKAEDVVYNWDLNCTKQGSAPEAYACEATVGKEVNVSVGVYAETGGQSLDTLWSEHTYQLTINDRPVNLAAFGSIDHPDPRVGQMRCWNVVLVASKPGKITFHESGVVDGEPFEYINTYVFGSSTE